MKDKSINVGIELVKIGLAAMIAMGGLYTVEGVIIPRVEKVKTKIKIRKRIRKIRKEQEENLTENED